MKLAAKKTYLVHVPVDSTLRVRIALRAMSINILFSLDNPSVVKATAILEIGWLRAHDLLRADRLYVVLIISLQAKTIVDKTTGVR